jgi:hypothetical protein
MAVKEDILWLCAPASPAAHHRHTPLDTLASRYLLSLLDPPVRRPWNGPVGISTASDVAAVVLLFFGHLNARSGWQDILDVMVWHTGFSQIVFGSLGSKTCEKNSGRKLSVSTPTAATTAGDVTHLGAPLWLSSLLYCSG